MSSCAYSLALRFSCNGQEKFEFWRKLVFGIESVGEINSSDSAVSMNLNSESLYVVGTIGSSGEITEIELNLVPALIKSHWHSTDKWLDSGCGLIVRCSESTSNALVIKDLYLEGEVFLEVLDNHDQERKLDSQCLLWVKRSIDIVG